VHSELLECGRIQLKKQIISEGGIAEYIKPTKICTVSLR